MHRTSVVDCEQRPHHWKNWRADAQIATTAGCRSFRSAEMA
jgi:hypothetical protein